MKFLELPLVPGLFSVLVRLLRGTLQLTAEDLLFVLADVGVGSFR